MGFGVQALHGLSFGFYLVAAMALLQSRVAPEQLATAQGLLASAMACGQIVGALLSGAVYDRFGILAVYGVSAAVMVLALGVFVRGGRRLGEGERLDLSHDPCESFLDALLPEIEGRLLSGRRPASA